MSTLFQVNLRFSRMNQKKEEKEEEAEKVTSFLEALAGALTRSAKSVAPRTTRLRKTTVSARGNVDYPAVEVVKGKTVELPFGPPYRPVVKAAYPSGADVVSLGMSLVGVAGERCTGLTLEGSRPPGPKFTIIGSDGEEVQTGKFEYG